VLSAVTHGWCSSGERYVRGIFAPSVVSCRYCIFFFFKFRTPVRFVLLKMGGHGEEGENPLHHKSEKLDLSFDPEERLGLTNDQVEELYKQWGYNELPEIKVSLIWLLFIQFTGTMPYMLELACIIALAVGDYPDFAIILAMLLANGFLSFHEQLKAAESLVSSNFVDFIFTYVSIIVFVFY
jgi:magnesium-transporting ATPase (P-type)